MVRTAFKILKATFGVNANNKALIPELFFSVNFESLLTDFHSVEETGYDDDLDAYIAVIDKADTDLEIAMADGEVTLSGSILQATERASDLRYTLFGNEGLFFRYALMTLEKKHSIYSMHACSAYDEDANHLYVVVGSTGSGKTCLLLAAIDHGLRLFSTEMTHFSLTDGLKFYKGALVDNVRIGNLKRDHRSILKRTGVKLPQTDDEWSDKVTVDLSWAQTTADALYAPKVTVIFPHIEVERRKNVTVGVTDPRLVGRALFDNMSEKIAQNVLLYDVVPLRGLDTPALMKSRYECANKFVERVDHVAKVLAGSNNCWNGLLK